jgi:hypothetical protein
MLPLLSRNKDARVCYRNIYFLDASPGWAFKLIPRLKYVGCKGYAGSGGAISLEAANDIKITGDLFSYSSSIEGNAGSGGAINLEAANDINLTGDLNSYSFSRKGTAGQGGAISLVARTGDIGAIRS